MMLTPTKLYFIRLKQHVRYIFKSVNSVLDWTVWIYFVIPMLVVATGMYVDLWRKFPLWAMEIRWDLSLVAAIGFLLLSAKLHIGVEEADQLILFQHERWLRVIKQWALGYSAIMVTVRMLLVMTLLLPFLLQTAGLSAAALIPLLLYSIVAAVVMLVINYQLNKGGKWWLRLLRSILRSILVALIWLLPAYGAVAGQWQLPYFFIALGLIAFFLVWRYAATSLAYGQQLRQEQEFRMKLTGALLSQVQEKQPSRRRKKPWIFGKSQRLFKRADVASVISELRIKAMLRTPSLLQVWATILATGSYALILVDGIGKVVVMAGLLFITRVWLHLQWEQWKTEQYLQIYLPETNKAKKLSQNLLTIPGLLIWLIVVIVSLLIKA